MIDTKLTLSNFLYRFPGLNSKFFKCIALAIAWTQLTSRELGIFEKMC